MSQKKSSTKKAAKGKAREKAPKLTPEQEREAEDFKQQAHEYAGKAYSAAVAHFEKFHDNPFALSRLAVIYEETGPGGLHMVVTLPGVLNEYVSETEAYEAIKDAELLARTLEHPDCTEAFKDALGSVYTEHILDGSEVTWTTPAVMRVMLPLALLYQWRECDGSAVTPTEILVTLSSTLVSDETSEDVRRSLGLKGVR